MTKVLGELMLTIGVVLLLFAFYEAYWTNVESGRLQDEANAKLEEIAQQVPFDIGSIVSVVESLRING